MTQRTLLQTAEAKLKLILGDAYGGPSVSYSESRSEFVIYEWHDAPVCTNVLGRGATLKAAIEDFHKNEAIRKADPFNNPFNNPPVTIKVFAALNIICPACGVLFTYAGVKRHAKLKHNINIEYTAHRTV